jgi:transcriptional regulator with GAF, ATPase, and Fis domain
MPATPADRAADLRDVALLAAQPGNLDATLGAALEALAEIVPYDLAAVLELDGHTLRVRCARGSLASARVASHAIDLTQSPQLQAALQSGRPRAFTKHDHDRTQGGDGDPYHGVVHLPDGHSCLVVPLTAGGRQWGAMTFDRSVCGRYDDTTIATVTVYGQLVALAMALAQANTALVRETVTLVEQNRALAAESGKRGANDFAHSESPTMREAITLVRQVAPTGAAVLITGETGTGKEVCARAIHEWSRRAQKPFLALNCSALSEQLVESELFGHVKGAFSGAERERPGRFLAADGGTLLLDEIGDLPLSAQAKLLRVLQEGTFEPVGSDRTVRVDVRILAATHVDVPAAVATGRFRADLYHRLAVFPVHLPALRERRDDIPRLAQSLLARIAARHRRASLALDVTALTRLVAYEWPGNIRELEHCLERAAIITPGRTIGVAALALPGGRRGTASAPMAPIARSLSLADSERAAIVSALHASGGRIYGVSGAAANLGLPPSTLQHRMRKLGITK